MDMWARYCPSPLFDFYSWSSTLSAPTPSSSSSCSLSSWLWWRPYVGHSWLLFLGSKEGWRNQQTAALPDYLSSFSSLHPCFWHTLILIIFQDSVLTNGLSAYLKHILQDKPKQVLHPNRREEREPLQNPKHLVFPMRPQCALHIVGHLGKLAEAHPSTHPSHQVFQ